MKLMTKQIEKALAKAPLYSTEKQTEKKIICKFFWGAFTWFVVEGEKQEDGDWCFFGIVNNSVECEWGYFTLKELQEVTWHGYPCIERDTMFEPTVINDINEVKRL